MVKKMHRTSESPYKNKLYLISSPIGNLKDITLRALEVLKSVDYLFCEDTRVTSKLLNAYDIKRELDSYHDHSSESKENYIISLLEKGYNVGLISDAGTPIISDPGFELVKKARDLGFSVSPIVGASASIAAIEMSALPMKPYLFYGFLNHKTSIKIKELEKLKDYDFSICFYESPMRIKDTLESMYKVFGERRCVISREITKLYEESIDLNLSEWNELSDDLKGEMVVVVEGKQESGTTKEFDLINEIDKLLKNGLSLKEASKTIANKINKKSSDIYNEYLRNKR